MKFGEKLDVITKENSKQFSELFFDYFLLDIIARQIEKLEDCDVKYRLKDSIELEIRRILNTELA